MLVTLAADIYPDDLLREDPDMIIEHEVLGRFVDLTKTVYRICTFCCT